MNKRTILLLAILLLLALVSMHYSLSVHENGKFIYPVDDSYIHMAISKNLALHNIFGISQYEFSATSSSLLHTLILALLFKSFGVNELFPLFYNTLAAIGILVFVYYLSIKYKATLFNTAVFFSLILFVTPLPALVVSGMEHILHILVVLVYLHYLVQSLQNKNTGTREIAILSLLSLIMVAVRFEGLFILGAASILLLFEKKYKTLLFSLIGGALPVIVFGIYSISQNSLFLPNSLLVKGSSPSMNLIDLVTFFSKWLLALWDTGHLLVFFLLFLIFLYFNREKKFNLTSKKSTLLSIIGLVVYIIHLSLAKTGWFFRYEAYLVAIGIYTLFLFLNENRNLMVLPKKLKSSQVAVAAFLLLVILFPLARRAGVSLLTTNKAINNIYDQQIQMAGFINKFYNSRSIAANDIGAISFYNDIQILDFVGLGTVEIIKNKHTDKTKLIDSLAQEKQVVIGVFYDTMFSPPEGWIKVGEWTIDNNVICAQPTVSFYGSNEENALTLKENMMKHSKYLPLDVSFKINDL